MNRSEAIESLLETLDKLWQGQQISGEDYDYLLEYLLKAQVQAQHPEGKPQFHEMLIRYSRVHRKEAKRRT